MSVFGHVSVSVDDTQHSVMHAVDQHRTKNWRDDIPLLSAILSQFFKIAWEPELNSAFPIVE
jgi:hypothetical protein